MTSRNGIERPTGAVNSYPGLYRGEVVDVADPEKRMRCRVRVFVAHPDSVPNAHLPWAEVGCSVGGKLHGDVPPFTAGDLVWIMFEGADRRFPVITGSWISQSLGVNDVPAELTTNYARDRARWVRVSRSGNKLELSDVPDELWAKLASGAAEVVCDSKDGSVTMRAVKGTVKTDAGVVDVSTKMFTVDSEQLIMTADVFDALGAAAGIMHFMANLRIILHSEGTTGRIDIGGYLPTYKGIASPATPGMQARQTKETWVRSRQTRIGQASGEVASGGLLPETELIRLDGVEILITSEEAVNSPSVRTVRIVIVSDGDVTVQSVGGTVTVEAPQVDVVGDTLVRVIGGDGSGNSGTATIIAENINLQSGAGGQVTIS